MRVLRFMTLASLLSVPLVAGAGQAELLPPALEIATRLQTRYDQVRDFSAEFVHTYEGGVLRKKVTERGTVLIKKPGKMRWSYTHPEEKLFLSDGVKIYSYLPADKQVIVNSMPAADQASTPVLFLVGRGNLPRDFVVSYDESSPAVPDQYALKLVPRRPEREYEWIVLRVARTSLQLRGLTTLDSQGGSSSFTFENLKENVGVSDKSFTFRIPRGVDVISGGNAPG